MHIFVFVHRADPDIVYQVYPIAFIEFCKDGDGKVTREGPRREKEELAAQDAWAVRFWMNVYLIYLILLTLIQRIREREYQRLRKEAEDKQKLYLDWARRFEIKSGGDWHPGEDGGSLYVYDLLNLAPSYYTACR